MLAENLGILLGSTLMIKEQFVSLFVKPRHRVLDAVTKWAIGQQGYQCDCSGRHTNTRDSSIQEKPVCPF